MPQISPLSWFFIPVIFCLFLVFLLVGFWWMVKTFYYFTLDKNFSKQLKDSSSFVWKW
uniref:ATP synthase F0 subunit 8 n=1 Tax=Emplectonema gracile TaxID=6230 RepID=H6BCG7_9BILA|nr:ATP synthase F0 subunit 8 [Emplectonema gracile]AEC12107.1 ATP synthase F0 subunit 8 [Emplectonema gracile]